MLSSLSGEPIFLCSEELSLKTLRDRHRVARMKKNSHLACLHRVACCAFNKEVHSWMHEPLSWHKEMGIDNRARADLELYDGVETAKDRKKREAKEAKEAARQAITCIL
jgi:hypothetical protein